MNIKKSGITLGKAMISAIPYVGGTIASIWNELESMQVERNFNLHFCYLKHHFFQERILI